MKVTSTDLTVDVQEEIFQKSTDITTENEVRLIEYCKQEGIKEHLTKNCQKKNEEALPAYLMISPENIAFVESKIGEAEECFSSRI